LPLCVRRVLRVTEEGREGGVADDKDPPHGARPARLRVLDRDSLANEVPLAALLLRIPLHQEAKIGLARLVSRPFDHQPDFHRDPLPLVVTFPEALQVGGNKELFRELRSSSRGGGCEDGDGVALRIRPPTRQLDQRQQVTQRISPADLALKHLSAKNDLRRGLLLDLHLKPLGQQRMKVMVQDRFQQPFHRDLLIRIRNYDREAGPSRR
jgi:hypothetical protein